MAAAATEAGAAVMWKRMRANLARLHGDRSGAVAIEYGLIIVLIVLILVSLHTAIGISVSNFFMEAANGL